MKKYIILLVMSISTWNAYAHAPNEAFFEYFVSENRLLIKAEFPWTIRNALLAAYPSLKTAQTKEEMNAGFLNYLREQISVWDKDGEKIQIESLKIVPNLNGHGHGNVYMLLMEQPYREIVSIDNRCMFEAYADQKNFHSITLPKQKTIAFITTNDAPSYNLIADEQLLLLAIGVGISLLLGLVIQKWRQSLL